MYEQFGSQLAACEIVIVYLLEIASRPFNGNDGYAQVFYFCAAQHMAQQNQSFDTVGFQIIDQFKFLFPRIIGSIHNKTITFAFALFDQLIKNFRIKVQVKVRKNGTDKVGFSCHQNASQIVLAVVQFLHRVLNGVLCILG